MAIQLLEDRNVRVHVSECHNFDSDDGDKYAEFSGTISDGRNNREIQCVYKTK